MKKPKPALHGHDFESSGHVRVFVDGNHETCRWCGWPFDEHPNHPTRRDNRSIVRVYLDGKRTSVFDWSRRS